MMLNGNVISVGNREKGDVLMNDVRLTVDSEAATSIHENGVVILHLGNGRVYAANETGAHIWRGIEQEESLKAIAAEISDEYQIPITSACEHIRAFIADLEHHSLVRRKESL
jgi:coenzyme PQQ synthesis protein D (PqqD)